MRNVTAVYSRKLNQKKDNKTRVNKINVKTVRKPWLLLRSFPVAITKRRINGLQATLNGKSWKFKISRKCSHVYFGCKSRGESFKVNTTKSRLGNSHWLYAYTSRAAFNQGWVYCLAGVLQQFTRSYCVKLGLRVQHEFWMQSLTGGRRYKPRPIIHANHCKVIC